MDQGFIAIFKGYYSQHISDKLINVIVIERRSPLQYFWEPFNILDAVKIIGGAWTHIIEKKL